MGAGAKAGRSGSKTWLPERSRVHSKNIVRPQRGGCCTLQSGRSCCRGSCSLQALRKSTRQEFDTCRDAYLLQVGHRFPRQSRQVKDIVLLVSASDMAQRKGDVHEVFCAASCSSTAARHLELGRLAMDGFRRL